MLSLHLHKWLSCSTHVLHLLHIFCVEKSSTILHHNLSMVRVLSLVAALSVTVAFKVPAADFAGGECVVMTLNFPSSFPLTP
jgi:hypothetical protein